MKKILSRLYVPKNFSVLRGMKKPCYKLIGGPFDGAYASEDRASHLVVRFDGAWHIYITIDSPEFVHDDLPDADTKDHLGFVYDCRIAYVPRRHLLKLAHPKRWIVRESWYDRQMTLEHARSAMLKAKAHKALARAFADLW